MLQKRGALLAARRARVHRTREHGDHLHLGGERTDIVDACDLAQLGQLLEAELELALGHELADQHARRRLLRLGFQLGCEAEALEELGEPVVFPAHPRTTAALEAAGIALPETVRVLPPVGYLDFAALASQARVILTDSGGVQKEAYWYGVPCVTLRPSTEWVDTVSAGANRLVDDDPAALAEAVAEARMPLERPQLYGDGKASTKIADLLSTLFSS